MLGKATAPTALHFGTNDLDLRLIDGYQLGVHPTVIGPGLSLFRSIAGRIDLKLTKTKTFECGALLLYYQPTKRISV